MNLQREHACLVLIDVQEKLSAAMEPAECANVVQEIAILIQGAVALELPVLWAEQYAKGMGPTLPALSQHMPEDAAPVDKVVFSCYQSEEFRRQLEDSGKKQVILCGMESHICVYQTARDLLQEGFEVWVSQDAIISRKGSNKNIGLQLMKEDGACISSTEAILFDLLKKPGGDAFKKIQRLIK